MTRRVVCNGCAPTWKKMVGKYPEEKVTLVEGLLHVDCVCDECNARLTIGTTAFCVSVSTPRTPYFSWEHEFVGAPSKCDE